MAITRAFSAKDIELFGYATPRVVQDKEHFVVYEAQAPGLRKDDAVFIHLKSTITNDAVKDAAKQLFKGRESYVVVPRSVEPRLAAFRSLIGNGVPCFVHEDLIWESLYKTFSGYLTALQEQLPSVEYYVTPRPEKAPAERLDSLVVSWLADRAEAREEHVMAVVAAAGIGKTTLSREVARRLAKAAEKNRMIPVYVEASHWAEMLNSFDDLWSVIGNSLRHFCPPLQLTKALFEHLLKSGDLAFVFDGFDELCSRRRGAFDPRDVLKELITLAEASSARIMLTSRTLYWESEIGDLDLPVYREDLAPFTKQQAYDYFEKRFGKDTVKLNHARTLFQNIRQQNQPPNDGGGKRQISYHPFVVDLIATAAQDEFETFHSERDSGSEMYNILRSFCEREQHRQQLQTSPDAQLAAFEDLAVEFDKDFSPEECLMAGFAEQDIASLRVHALLDYSTGDNRLSFSYDFLSVILRARYLIRSIAEYDPGLKSLPDRALRLMEQESAGRGFIVDHVKDFWSEQTPLDRIRMTLLKVPSNHIKARSFLFQLAKGLVNEQQRNLSKAERSIEVLRVICGIHAVEDRLIRDLYVQGSIEKFDFQGFRFERCIFEDFVFSDCDADGSTVFDDCRFLGDAQFVGGDRGWAQVRIEPNCELQLAAKLAFLEFTSTERPTAVDVAEQSLELALSKFWKGGRLQRSIAKPYWMKGTLGRHPLGKTVLAALLKEGVLEEIEIGGMAEGGYAIKMTAIGDLQRLMDNRQKTGSILRAYNNLIGR